jgi:hypothetical protein
MDDLAHKLKDLELKAKSGIEIELYQGLINDFKEQTSDAIIELKQYINQL